MFEMAIVELRVLCYCFLLFRSLTKMWVSHSLEQGDIGRILEPLLLLLLHPSTARVSDFHCEREKKKRQQMKDNQSEHEDKEVQDRTKDINKEHHATFEDNNPDKRHTESKYSRI